MKIGDQGFTERLTTQNSRGAGVTTPSSASENGRAAASGFSDSLQLSNLATQLQKAAASDASRTARVSQIAAAVQNGTFRVNTEAISTAMVSEAIQGGR